MRNYAVFGGTLRSELDFPDLSPATSGAPDWFLRTAEAPAPELPDAVTLGSEEVDTGIGVRLLRSGTAYRLQYDDSGDFDVDGPKSITWYPGTAASLELARLDVIGRVLALALHADGWLPLHGSAVALGDGVVTFLAPKHHGKSTLALALASAGGRLVTDDTLPVRPGTPVIARPGVHRVRLWGDSAALLGAAPSDAGEKPFSEPKHLAPSLPPERVQQETAPLAAVYLLCPVKPEAAEAASRVQVHPVAAAMQLVRHAKLGQLLGGSDAGELLSRAASVVSQVPVYELRVVRDFARLPHVIAKLLEWHGAVGSLDAPPAGAVVASA